MQPKKAPLPAKKCTVCSASFVPSRAWQVFCSPQCRYLDHNRRQVQRVSDRAIAAAVAKAVDAARAHHKREIDDLKRALRDAGVTKP